MISFCVKGQDTLSSLTVEQKSYQLYLDKKWSELENFGKTALDNGYDYYYLRMRLGIAYFEQKKYIAAQKHFEKALDFSSRDNTALEYLYYCFLNTGRYEDARWLTKSFGTDLSKRLGTDSLSRIGFILLEGGLKTSDSSNRFGPGFYLHGGISHYMFRRFSLFHAPTYFTQTMLNGTGSQLQYYLRSNVPLKNNFMLTASVHWMERKTTENLPPPPPHPGHKPPPPKSITTSNDYFVGYLGAKKNIPQADIGTGITVSNVFNSTQYLHNLTVNVYPLKNYRVTLGCVGYMYTEDNYINNYFAINPYLAVIPHRALTLSVSYLSNQKSNIVELNGYVINNSPDLTFSRWSFLASLGISKKVDLYGLYQFENKIESAQKFTYHYSMFVLGLKIKP